MKTKAQKHESFGKIKEKLSKAKITIVTSFAQAGSKGLNVSMMKDLRKSLRPLDSEYEVTKKTVLDKALTSDQKASHIFTNPGSIGVAYGYGDPFAIAKALYQFAKKNAALKLYGAYLGSEFMDEAHLMEMAMLPSKEVLIGRLVGMLSYPIRGLVVTLDQIAQKK
ncbi:MAG: 50S ribosomal protein L10 [Patescibacteria group bacterium]